MSIQVGQPAPDFTLFNTEKQEVSLSSFKGKNVVVLFFPLALPEFARRNYALFVMTSPLIKDLMPRF